MRTGTTIFCAALFAATLLIAPACKKSGATASAPDASSKTSHLQTMPEAARRKRFEADLRLVRRYDEGLTQTLAYAKGRPDLFVKSEDVQLSPKQKHELRTIWQSILDYMRALDRIKEFWKGFMTFGPLSQRRAHVESFLVGYVAWLVQFRHGLEFVQLTVPSKPMEKLLDEAAPKFDIAKGSFAALKWNVIHVKAVTRLLGSHQYFKTIRGALQDADCARRAPCAWAVATVDRYDREAVKMLRKRAAIEFSYNAFDIARDMTFDAWFPVQKNVAEWMGDTKYRHLHHTLITPKELDGMRAHLQPGDVLVVRHNWYLSNIGLPGFWPHALLYVGSPKEMRSYFDDDAVKQYAQAKWGAPDFPTHLAKSYPKAWKAYVAARKHPNRVIEAVSEGVIMNSLEHAAAADYVGAMRPQGTKVDDAVAIERAFAFWGRPYDFNFDFTTDDTLVCSELVYKSWRAAKNSALGVAPEKVMGRMTLPPNDIVRAFDDTCDKPDPPLKFVYFIDGLEKADTAVVETRAAFRKTWERPKWDGMQE